MKKWLFLLLFLPVIAFGQFRMVSSTVTLDSTVNDSTYIIDVDFFSDQTAKGYFASGITADYRVFSQTGQLYDITAARNLTLSSGELTIVEIDNNYVNTESAPVGQILVFDPQGDYITFTPFGNSNMGQVLQQAIGTYNAVVSAEGGSVPEWSGTANYEQFKQVSQDGKIYTNRTGTNTTTPPSSDLVNWELTNKSAILEEIEGRDTISQASHPFSVGDPLWYSGNYILARDTGASVRVDGIVVEVIDANTFVRQRSGKFTLSSHGFTANIQLYVQDDGSYGTTAGDNALVYGYAINANEIEIGAKPDQIRNIANKYPDLFAGRGVQTTIEMLDSLSGFQSFADITSILLAEPTVGFVLEDRNTGTRYKVMSDTIPGLPIDNVYQQDIGGGKYLIIENRHSFTFTDESIDSIVIREIARNTNESIFNLSITEASNSDIVFSLPEQISSRKNITINIDDSSPKDIVIQGTVTDGNYVFDSYKASDGENIVLPYTGSKYRLITNKINSFYESDKPLDYNDIPSDYDLYNGGLVGYNSSESDSLFVLERKKSWNVKSNLIRLSSFFTHISTPTWVGSTSKDWRREKVNTPSIKSDYSFKLTLDEDNPDQLANSYTFATPTISDTLFSVKEYNFSFYALIPNGESKNVALTVKPQGALSNSLKTIIELDTNSIGEWKRYNGVVAMDVDTVVGGRFWISVSGDSSDYILIQDFQLTEGPYLQPYQKTHETLPLGGSFSVVYKGIGDGRIYVDNVPNYYGLSDNEVIQRAFDFARHTPKSAFYLYSTNRFNTVYIQKDKLLTETIERPEGINLESNYGAGNAFNDLANHAVIYSDLQDSTKSLFTYVDELSDNVVSGAVTKNVALEALSRQRTFFLNEQLVDMLYQDIYIVSDSLSDYGIENVSSVNSNLYNTFRRIEVNEPREAGLMLRGTPNFVIDCKFFRGGHAIHAEAMTWIHGMVAEQQDLPIVKFNALTSFSCRDVYCEVNTTPFFQIDKATNIDIRGGLIGTVKAGNTGGDYLIELDSVLTGNISGIFAHGGIGNRISTTANTGHITINNTIGNNPTYAWPGPQTHESWDGIADSTKIISWGNTSIGSTDDPSFWMPYLFYSTGFPDTSQLQEQLQIFRTESNSLDSRVTDLETGPSYGEAYIDYLDPDSVTVVTSGTLYDFADVLEGSSSSDVTVSTTTARLTYTGTTEKLFQVTWTATITSDAVSENLIGTVLDNGSTITRIRWEEEDTASGDKHSVAASGFFSMGQNDWVQPKLTSQNNGTQIEVITMSFRIQEVR